MKIHIEETISTRKKALILFFVPGIIIGAIAGGLFVEKAMASYYLSSTLSESEILPITQDNSILPLLNIPLPEKVQKVKMIVTAYSSTPWETDGDPFITASGARVRDGIVANNLLPFGTKIRIPEIYGDKIFEVKDRMNSRKSAYHVDIWFPEHWQAKNFGAQRAYVEILEN